MNWIEDAFIASWSDVIVVEEGKSSKNDHYYF